MPQASIYIFLLKMFRLYLILQHIARMRSKDSTKCLAYPFNLLQFAENDFKLELHTFRGKNITERLKKKKIRRNNLRKYELFSYCNAFTEKQHFNTSLDQTN